MLAKSKIALLFAFGLGATSVSPTTHAFAQNDHPNRGRYDLGSRNGKTENLQMNLDERWNDIRDERSRNLGASPRWIDDPASPGG
jgi:hypothetical protein